MPGNTCRTWSGAGSDTQITGFSKTHTHIVLFSFQSTEGIIWAMSPPEMHLGVCSENKLPPSLLIIQETVGVTPGPQTVHSQMSSEATGEEGAPARLTARPAQGPGAPGSSQQKQSVPEPAFLPAAQGFPVCVGDSWSHVGLGSRPNTLAPPAAKSNSSRGQSVSQLPGQLPGPSLS